RPDDTKVTEAFFRLHLSQQQWDEATKYAQALAEANADNAGGNTYWFQMAMARGAGDSQERRKAIDLARQMTADLPEFGQSWFSLGEAYRVNGDPAQAIQQYLLALEKQPQNDLALRGLIQCSYALNRPNDALSYIEQALRLRPGSAEYREMLAA